MTFASLSRQAQVARLRALGRAALAVTASAPGVPEPRARVLPR